MQVFNCLILHEFSTGNAYLNDHGKVFLQCLQHYAIVSLWRSIEHIESNPDLQVVDREYGDQLDRIIEAHDSALNMAFAV